MEIEKSSFVSFDKLRTGALKIGIWGLGVVGKSVARFLDSKNIPYSVLDCSLDSKDPEGFLESNDLIIPSPGIDLRPWQKYSDKFLAEVDLFAKFFNKPTIGITGTLGKTTVTYLINELLKNNSLKSIAAGNIGRGMCDIINQQEELDFAVLELSSFQLEQCKSYVPKVAVLTNFFSNHLDRHATLQEYKQAKLNLFKKQTSDDFALVPLQLAKDLESSKAELLFFATEFGDFEQFKNVYFLDQDAIYFWDGVETKQIAKLTQQQKQKTFAENWLVICATLHILSYTNFELPEFSELPEYRMQRFEKDGVIFYNDSKSTVAEATIKAVESCSKPILFLGGLSKGVDRSFVFEKIKNKVSSVICFGKEAEQLHSLCSENKIRSWRFKNLEDAVEFCMEVAKKGDEVLFSPGGSSFDLFKNYCARGKRFNELVNQWGAHPSIHSALANTREERILNKKGRVCTTSRRELS